MSTTRLLSHSSKRVQATHAVNATATIAKARQLWLLPSSEVNAYGDSITTGAARAFEEEETMKVPHPDTLMPPTVRPDTLTLPLYYSP